MCLSSLTLPAESDVKMEGREEELGGEEGGEEGEERKGKQTSWSQEHLLALRKESEESVANRNLTKSPSTGLTKYLTGTDHLLRVAFSFEIHDTQIYSFLFFAGSYARQEWKATLTVCLLISSGNKFPAARKAKKYKFKI